MNVPLRATSSSISIDVALFVYFLILILDFIELYTATSIFLLIYGEYHMF